MLVRIRFLSAVVIPLAVIACVDKAQPDYAKCVQADALQHTRDAWEACNSAVSVDPDSSSGKAAAVKLSELKPKYDAWKQADDAQQAKDAEQQRQVRQAAQATRLKTLRATIRRKYWADEPDSLCTGKGLPQYRWDYDGGTFAEDAEVAGADGCQSPFSMAENTTYCCPQRPNVIGF